MTFFWICFGLLFLYTLACFLAHLVHWVKVKLYPEKTEDPMLGVLDFFDMGTGRVSDSDQTKGKRKRSFGQTVFVQFSLPLVFLTVTYGASMIIVSYSTRPTVSMAETINYQSCIRSAKGAKEKAKCKTPKAQVGKSIAKILDGGKWPWIGGIVLLLCGMVFALIRREQDFSRAKELMSMGLSYAKEGKPIPGWLSSATDSAMAKITNVVVNQGEQKATPTKEAPKTEAEAQSGGGGRVDAA